MVLIVSTPDGEKKETKDWEATAQIAGVKIIVIKYNIQQIFQRHEFVFLSIPDISEPEKKRITETLKEAGIKTVIITDKAVSLVNI